MCEVTRIEEVWAQGSHLRALVLHAPTNPTTSGSKMPMQAPGRDLPLTALFVCWLAETKLLKSWAAADSFDMHGVSKNPASPAEMEPKCV